MRCVGSGRVPQVEAWAVQDVATFASECTDGVDGKGGGVELFERRIGSRGPIGVGLVGH